MTGFTAVVTTVINHFAKTRKTLMETPDDLGQSQTPTLSFQLQHT